MNVLIDDNAGFCFGVVKAIGIAEERLCSSPYLYCLGDIVHNNAEVSRLNTKGLKVIDYDKFSELSNTQVLIRAHGEPPSTYAMAAERHIRLIDATCPIVLALQQKVRLGYESMCRVGGQVVIFGKQGHAEVIGLNGQTENHAVIVSSIDDIGSIDFERPVRLYSQTTQNREEYAQLVGAIRCRMKVDDFQSFDTICNRVANRAKSLASFASSVDMVLFVSGEHSSNGHYLYEYCRKVQPKTYLVADRDGVSDKWFKDVETIGITGATSTPRWLMEEVGDWCRKQ